jgi:hypothetical protein
VFGPEEDEHVKSRAAEEDAGRVGEAGFDEERFAVKVDIITGWVGYWCGVYKDLVTVEVVNVLVGIRGAVRE